MNNSMKNSTLVFCSLAASLLLTGISNLQAKAQSSSNWVEEALGSYQSQIWGAIGLVPGTTEFRETNDGSLEGSYSMNEQGRLVPGTLSRCEVMQVRVMRCIWNDKYGSGYLEVTFSEDFSEFSGYWGVGSSEPTYPWNGSR